MQPRGVGCPVTGNFSVRNSGVMTLFLDGVQKPLELTEGHRLFSATRGDWVPAVELRIGEALETLDGVVAVAGRVVESARVERVFNLEVADVHAYHVGGVGVLAHNQDGACDPATQTCDNAGQTCQPSAVQDKIQEYVDSRPSTLEAVGNGAKAYAEGLGTAAAHEMAKTGLLGDDALRHAEQIDLLIGAAAALVSEDPGLALGVAMEYAKVNKAFIAGRVAGNSLVTFGSLRLSGGATGAGLLAGPSLAVLSTYGSMVSAAQQGVLGLPLAMSSLHDNFSLPTPALLSADSNNIPWTAPE